jgi:hypothetical protein
LRGFADNVLCIADGAIARELAPNLLKGTNIKLFNETLPVPYSLGSKNGWMTTSERDRNVKVACKVADIICGGEPIIFDNIKDIKMIQSVSGSMQFLEIQHAAVMLRWQFLQDSGVFLYYPFLSHFFNRNHYSCSAVTFSEPPQKSCLYGAYKGH